MRTLKLAAVLSCAVASGALAASLPAPIAPASDGKLQCYMPKPATKSCQSLAGYKLGLDGVILNPAAVLISPQPAIIMRAVTPVSIKAQQVCGTVRAEDIAAAEFMIDGNPATDAQAAMLRKQIIAAQSSLIGHEICTTYVPDGDGQIAKAFVDGVAQPAMDQKVMWVSARDGFKVQP